MKMLLQHFPFQELLTMLLTSGLYVFQSHIIDPLIICAFMLAFPLKMYLFDEEWFMHTILKHRHQK